MNENLQLLYDTGAHWATCVQGYLAAGETFADWKAMSPEEAVEALASTSEEEEEYRAYLQGYLSRWD